MASRSAILAVGGAEDKFDRREVLERFVREAGGGSARIAILPTASTVPEERATFYQKVFGEIGAESAVHVPIVTREDADGVEYARLIAGCTGVFLTTSRGSCSARGHRFLPGAARPAERGRRPGRHVGGRLGVLVDDDRGR